MPKNTKNKAIAGKLDLAGLGEPVKSSVIEYPVVPDAKGRLGRAARQINLDRTEIKALNAQVKVNSALIVQTAVPFYFEQVEDLEVALTGVCVELDVPSQEIPGATIRERQALVIVNDKYPLVVDAKKVKVEDVKNEIIGIIGKTAYDANFEEAAVVAVAIEKIVRERRQDFIDDLKKIVRKYELKDAVTVKHGIQAKSGFHDRRCRAFTPLQNTMLQAVYPATVSVKSADGKD